MASSSSSISTPPWMYDVFLSFRGIDTRNGFTSHLYEALCRNDVDTYIDYELHGGEKIEPALLERIEESYISVVIFSTNYADSTFCLRELSKILECKETKGQMVIPVFYQVDPSHVQELSGSFGDALARHEQDCSSAEVQSWRHALKESASLKGWDSNVTKPETKLINEIVTDILKKLEQLMPLGDSKALVGIDSRVKKVESLLAIGSLNVRIVGVVGMGGIGKTTIAELVFDRICNQFEGRCFLPNVREELERCTLVGLRDRILSQVLGKENLNIGTLNRLPTDITRKLRKKKVLIVLDDVSSPPQVKALLGDDGLFGPGSRIVVTSRDKQVLRYVKADIYEVENLGCQEALRLFGSHAFQENHPTGEYRKLSKWLARYCKGNPLALKVLGSNLFGKCIEDWKSEKEKLEGTGALNMEIQKCFRISFDGLDQTQKDIFLDIACFFKTCDKDRVQELWKLSEFHPTTAISNLSDKCLINVSESKIGMHDLLQQLGQDIVCEVKVPRKRSRLWIPKDIVHILTHPKGTEAVEAISLDMSRIKEMELTPTAFQEMYNLRLLEFCNPEIARVEAISRDMPRIKDMISCPLTSRFLDFSHPENELEGKIHFPRGLEFLPDKLVLLHWDQYPLKSLPSNFCTENLAELRVTYSQLEQVFDGSSPLENLKVMDLRNSRKLIGIPDFSIVPNLRDLNLSGCRRLNEIPCNIDEYCSKLATLNLSNCENLCSFPSCLRLTSLNILRLHGCPKIVEFPMLHCNVKELYLGYTGIEKVPSSIGDLYQLIILDMEGCKRLETLPSNIGRLKCLKSLGFKACSKLANLPNRLCDLKSLEQLNLLCCPNVNTLPDNLGNLKSLRFLAASKISEDSFLHIGKLGDFDFESGEGLTLPPFTEDWGGLTSLYLSNCGIAEIPRNLGFLLSLRELNLSMNKFESMPASINELSKLTNLKLWNCQRLRCLPELPSSLKHLDVSHCISLESVASIFTQVENGYEAASENFNFVRCFSFEKNVLNIKIMDEVGFRIQRLATSLFNQGYDADYEYGDPIGARFCFPGSEVPKWFSHQNTHGSSVIQVKPHRYGSQFLGCVFCVVLGPKEYDSLLWELLGSFQIIDIRCECHLMTESGSQDISCILDINPGIDLESEHMFVWYDSKFSSNYCFSEASFQFHVKSRFSEASFQFHAKSDTLGCEVIKCGVSLLYAHDENPDVEVDV